jgi:hypothetical protein
MLIRVERLAVFPLIAYGLLPASISLLVCPGVLWGQSLGRDALSNFPADTRAIVYSNIARLRVLPEYPRIRQRIFTQPLSHFEDFLRSVGIDTENDVDEVTVGTRGDAGSTSSFFGLAEGRFRPDEVHDLYVQHRLACQRYAGYDLYASHPGGDDVGLYFVLFDSSSAAFGRFGDLKAILDVRAGTDPALNSIREFADGEAELEGSATQWGVARGGAVPELAVPWLTGGPDVPGDLKSFLSPVRWVLYQFDWEGGLTLRLTMVCQDSESAARLAQALVFLRNLHQIAGASTANGIDGIFRELDVETSSSRVKVSASVSLETARHMLGVDLVTPTP